MVLTPILCPDCGSDNVRKNGHCSSGKQRYLCKNAKCSRKTFALEYTYHAYDPNVRKAVYEHAVNGSGTRATARILKINKDTVTRLLKKKESLLSQVNEDYINRNCKQGFEIDLVRVEEAEADEMWSFVQNKKNQLWLWWIIDHKTGEPLAYCFGTKEHIYLDELRKILRSSRIKIKTIYTDGNQAYLKITESKVVQGKRNTQKIESKHTALRTWCSRLVRKGIRFSKTIEMHKIAVGLVINFWFFGRVLW